MTTQPDRPALKDGPPDGPDPTAAPSRSAHLLGLVHSLIAFGKSLLETLQRDPGPNERFGITHRFGTKNIALIIARITRGLLIAGALDDRLVHSARQLDRRPSSPCPITSRTPAVQSRPARGRAIRPEADDAELLARLPTAEEIAAQIRHRPIGRVLEDICRDLGILPSDKLWRDLLLPIIANGGDSVRLLEHVAKRVTHASFDWSLRIPASATFAPPPEVATGPP